MCGIPLRRKKNKKYTVVRSGRSPRRSVCIVLHLVLLFHSKFRLFENAELGAAVFDKAHHGHLSVYAIMNHRHIVVHVIAVYIYTVMHYHYSVVVANRC